MRLYKYKGSFYQQLHLIHRGFARPMVMETGGYNGEALDRLPSNSRPSRV